MGGTRVKGRFFQGEVLGWWVRLVGGGARLVSGTSLSPGVLDQPL